MMQQGCVYEMAVNVFNMLNDTSSGKYWRKKKKGLRKIKELVKCVLRNQEMCKFRNMQRY